MWTVSSHTWLLRTVEDRASGRFGGWKQQSPCHVAGATVVTTGTMSMTAMCGKRALARCCLLFSTGVKARSLTWFQRSLQWPMLPPTACKAQCPTKKGGGGRRRGVRGVWMLPDRLGISWLSMHRLHASFLVHSQASRRSVMKHTQQGLA